MSDSVHWVLRGWKKQQLIRELAEGLTTKTDLGKKYGVTVNAIVAFGHRHAEQIQMAKDNFEDEFAALWIAKKAARLAEYQEDVERVTESLEREIDSVLLKVKHSAMQRVAEEMGQLPTKHSVQVEQKTVHYIIEGVDPEDLK